MKIGAVFPTCEIGQDPRDIREFAQTAESLGYSHIVAYDHVLGAEHENRAMPLFGPYSEADSFHEPMVLFGFLAAHTQKIKLCTGVLVLPQRQTALVAKQAAQIHLLSEGRFELGVGTGWNFVEYEALGTSFDVRGPVLSEQVELLRMLWNEPVLDYKGEFHRINRAGIKPRPSTKIPVHFGGGAAALGRAARMGDGFIFGASNDQTRADCRRLLELLDTYGRRSGFKIDVLIGFGDGPEHWKREYEAWDAIGIDSMTMRAMSTATTLLGEKDPRFTSPNEHIDALAHFMNEVG